MSLKTKNRLTLTVWVYGLLVGPLAGFAVYRLNALAKDGLAENKIGAIAGFIIVFTALYLVRAILLTLPLLADNIKLSRISNYGLVAVALPELVVFYTVVHFTVSPPAHTTNPDNWADAFAPAVVLVPLAFAIIAQFIGMAVGCLATVHRR